MSTNINDLLKNPEQIKQMIGLLSTLLEAAAATESVDDETTNETETVAPRKTKNIDRKTQRENKFATMPEATMHKEDPELAKRLYKQPPTARTRKNHTVKARCRVCGREEKIQSSLLYGGLDRFKCNKCSTTPG